MSVSLRARTVRSFFLLTSLGLFALFSANNVTHAAPSGKYFDYSLTILMENNNLSSVLSQGQYQAKLGSDYALSRGYSALTHPSEPNYSTLVSGQIGVNGSDGICCGQDSSQNLVDLLESHGLSWKAYAEDLTNGDCTGGPIDTDHFPFLFFSDITTNPARCNNLQGATASTDQEFINTLNLSSGWPNYLWLTPNKNNDAHDTTIPYGDNYLSQIVPRILGSTLFQSQRAALFIVYDEGNDETCSNGIGTDCVYAAWAGPTVKKGFSSTTAYTHYSYLHTIEDNWALPTLTGNDANAPIMSEFFTGNAPSSGTFWTSQLIELVIGGIVIGLIAVIAARTLRGKKHPLDQKPVVRDGT